jgi:hypothetical protein
MNAEMQSWGSLSYLDLYQKLQPLPKERQAEILSRLLNEGGEYKTHRDKQIVRDRRERSEAARIVIPDCVDPARREACLADPERFLRTYFAGNYRLGFGRDHRFMIESFVDCARSRRWQAVAAPRGRGKSEIVKGILVYIVLAGLVRFPLAVAATTDLASRLYVDFKRKLAQNELLLADFPEVCFPVRALEGAPQRASKQHVDGKLTNIIWTGDYVRLPTVENSPYGGVKMTYYGLDAAFRGANIDGDRPDFVIIDDPETRESAKSLGQIADREAILEQDIVGLKSQESNIAIVVLTTCQNRYSLSYRLTDPKQKPAFNGRRFGMVATWPTNMEQWQTYIAMRHADQAAGDPNGMSAVAYYLEHRSEMDAGAEMLSDHYVDVTLDDGTPVVHSALQQAFNQIGNTSMEAYFTEYQNDPPAEEAIETVGLTAARVQSRISQYPQRECSSATELRVIGIDLGKFNSHWVDTAWEGAAIGSVVDYGVMETHGLTAESDAKAVELAILASLEVWADEIVAPVNPLLVLIDSGTFTEAVYEFCRRRGRPFFPAKGWADSRFHMPQQQDHKQPFLEAWAHFMPQDRVWLYNVNTEWWKRWTHQRFLTATYDDAGNRNDGSLALFDPLADRKRHLSYAHHITAEEEQLVPVHGKEMKRVWFVKNRNNHWLDATALACAGAGCCGVRLVSVQQQEAKPIERKVEESKPLTDPYGRPFVASFRR